MIVLLDFGRRDPDSRGYYGPYGGCFVPETLIAPLEELERAYLSARTDEGFRAELASLFTDYVDVPRRCMKRGGSRPRFVARASPEA